MTQSEAESAMCEMLADELAAHEALARHAECKRHGHGLAVNDSIRYETGLRYWVAGPGVKVAHGKATDTPTQAMERAAATLRDFKRLRTEARDAMGTLEHADLLNQEQANRLMQILLRNARDEEDRRIMGKERKK